MPDSPLSFGFLGQLVDVRIDRPAGSHHPTHGFPYPVNYGYLPDVPSGDGEELDAYVLGVPGPIQAFRGRCIAVIHRLEEDDDKLVVVPDGVDLPDARILELTHFQEQYFASVLVRQRPDPDPSR